MDAFIVIYVAFKTQLPYIVMKKSSSYFNYKYRYNENL